MSSMLQTVNPNNYDKNYLTKIRLICFHELKQPHYRPIPSLSKLERHEFLKLFQKYLLQPTDEIDSLFEIISGDLFDSTDQNLNLKNKETLAVKEGRHVAPAWFALPSYENGVLQPSVLDMRIQETLNTMREEAAVAMLGLNDP